MGSKTTKPVNHNYQQQSEKVQCQLVNFDSFKLQAIPLNVISGLTKLASLESGFSQVGLIWHRITSRWLESSMIDRRGCPGGK